MSKLLEDPKVADLVEKSEAKATKAEAKRAMNVVKEVMQTAINTAREAKDHNLAKQLVAVKKDLNEGLKEAA